VVSIIVCHFSEIHDDDDNNKRTHDSYTNIRTLTFSPQIHQGFQVEKIYYGNPNRDARNTKGRKYNNLKAIRIGDHKAAWPGNPFGPGEWQIFDLSVDPGDAFGKICRCAPVLRGVRC
jgi:hypothetical protein